MHSPPRRCTSSGSATLRTRAQRAPGRNHGRLHCAIPSFDYVLGAYTVPLTRWFDGIPKMVMNAHGILIVGGSGVVGSRIAEQLAPDYGDRVIVAGRNLDRAKVIAAAIGHGVHARVVDVNVPSSIAAALDDVAVVISSSSPNTATQAAFAR